MQLDYVFYSVVITAISGTDPKDGFIDNLTVGQYLESTGNYPTTLAHGKAKARANRRFKSLIEQIDVMSNFTMSNIDNPGGDNDTPPTSFGFDAFFEFEHTVFTPDELNPGVILTGEAAVVRCLARALIITETLRLEYFDPTTDGVHDGFLVGMCTTPLEIGALCADIATAEGNIVCVKVLDNN